MKLLRILADVVVPALALFAIGLALYLCACAHTPPRPDDGRNNDLFESMP